MLPEAEADAEALQVRFDCIASKLHVQHLHHWWAVISHAFMLRRRARRSLL